MLNMKRLVLLSLLLFPIFLFAQYPTFSNKQRLGVQTTGDGLIFRGTTVNNIPTYTPSNVNNAYFHLDTISNKLYLYNGGWQQVYPAPQFDTTTLNVYLKISDTTAMLLPYFRDSDTTQLNLINRFALKLNISDTSVMLSPYLRKADTISLSNRIDLKFNTSDTTILSNRITTNANNIITINTKLDTKLDTIYVKFKDVVTRVLNKDTINIGSSLIDGYAINIIGDSINIDTTILDIRYPDRDSTNELQSLTFATTSGVIVIPGDKVMNLDTLYDSVIDSVKNLIQDSIAAFIPVTEGYGINIIGDSINIDTTIIFTQSDTITLSNRIDLKLNISDTISLSNRIDTKLNITDTIILSNRIDTKLNISDTTNMLLPYFRDADTSLLNLTSRFALKLNASDTASLSNRINLKLDTIYAQYPTYLDTITNKETITIPKDLTEGFGINIIADSINIDSAVILTTQQKQIAYVKNQSGATMYKGQAVYSSGSTGDNKLVLLASSSTEQTSSKTFGIVETDSIPTGSHGYIITFGLLSGFNTNGLTEGSSVYLSSTPGQLTTTKPQAPLHLVTIGVCIRQQQNNGSIFVKIQNGFELDELHDVRITSPVNNASLYYSGGLWRDTTATLLVSDTASMLNPYLRKLDTLSLSNRINLKFNTVDTAILGYVTTYSNQFNINGNKTFNNTVSVDSLNATKQAKIQSLTVGKGGYAIIGGIPGGISSTAFGFEALKNNTSGDYNTAIGYQSLLNNTIGWENIAVGNNSLLYNNSGEYNTAIGIESLASNVSGNRNTAIGYYAGINNKGSNNIYIGNQTYHDDSINNTLMIGGINTPLLSGITTGNKKLGVNTNPLNLTYTFEVNSPISNSVKINSNTNSTNLELMNSGGSVFIKSSNKNMTLQTDTTALVYLKGDVNRVGILTMNPEQALEVAGTIRVDSLDNNLTPFKLVGASNSNDLTNVELGTGLSFVNDTLKIADNIINSGDTATLLRKDYLGINTNVLVWTEGNKKLLPYFTQVYRNGQLLKSDSQYTITSDSIVTLEEGSYRLNDNITIIAIDNVIALAGSGGFISLQGDVSGSGTNTITTTIGTGKVTNTMLAGGISNNKLDVITTAGKVSNSATTATNLNTNNAIVSRDDSGNFIASTITANLSGNANTATTLATGRTLSITGDLTYTSPSFNGSANVTAAGTLANSGVTANTYTAATITVDAKGRVTSASNNTIPTVNNGTLTLAVSGSGLTGSQSFTANQSSAATFTVTSNATNANTPSTIVFRDASGNFSANIITAANGFLGNATSSTNATFAANVTNYLAPIESFKFRSNNNNTGSRIISFPDGDITVARTDAAQTFTGTQTFSSTINGSINGNAATATNVAYSGLTGTVPIWNQNTTGTAATITGVYSGTITSSQITTGLGFTPYNATNPNSYISRTGLSFVAGSGAYNNTTGVITIPTNNNQITNGAGYITSSSLSPYATLASPTFTGTVSGITKTMVGLSNVDNTTDLNKPVSTATQTALNLKQNTLTNPVTGTGTINTLPLFTGASTLGNSILQQSSNNIGINTTPFASLTLGQGKNIMLDASSNNVPRILFYETNARNENDVQFGAKIQYNSPSDRLEFVMRDSFSADPSGDELAISIVRQTGNVTIHKPTTLSSTLAVQGDITENGNNVLTSADTSSLSNRINGKVSLTATETIGGTKTFNNLVNITNQMTLSGSVEGLNQLIGKKSSNNYLGDITLGSGLNITSNVLNVSSKITDINTSQYSITSTDVYIDNFNNSSTTIILPLAGLNTYRELKFKNSSTGALIANGNIIPLSGSGTTTTILPATNAKWCTLVSDGAFWRIMQSN